jgi:hypothetical protein
VIPVTEKRGWKAHKVFSLTRWNVSKGCLIKISTRDLFLAWLQEYVMRAIVLFEKVAICKSFKQRNHNFTQCWFIFINDKQKDHSLTKKINQRKCRFEDFFRSMDRKASCWIVSKGSFNFSTAHHFKRKGEGQVGKAGSCKYAEVTLELSSLCSNRHELTLITHTHRWWLQLQWNIQKH